jgi:hypothetical protein
MLKLANIHLIVGKCIHFSQKSDGKRPPGDLGIGGRIMLRWILRKYYVSVWTGLSWLRIGYICGLL